MAMLATATMMAAATLGSCLLAFALVRWCVGGVLRAAASARGLRG
jgi:hypothetical protein